MAVRIKGQAFLGFLAALKRVHGAEDHAAVMRGLPRRVAAALESGEITTMGWYPVEWYTAMHASARHVCGTAVSRVAGREAAKADLNSIYRFVLKYVSPETLLAQSSKVFGLFCDGGKCTVTGARAGSARLFYTDCAGASRGMWELIAGVTELIVELCGGKGVSCKILSGGGDGDATMLLQLTWMP